MPHVSTLYFSSPKSKPLQTDNQQQDKNHHIEHQLGLHVRADVVHLNLSDTRTDASDLKRTKPSGTSAHKR